MESETLTPPPLLNQPLKLPNGAIIKNRLAKSAMSENMGTPKHLPSIELFRLYETWADGGIGLCITGNIMVDASALGEPHNVVIDKNADGKKELASWAKAGTQNYTHLWAQLNHPGKQSPKILSPTPVAPSAIPFSSSLNKMFNCPRALSENEILEIIQKFAYAAKEVKDAGFTGVQIHGAHGYLVSQFLSPKHNQRQDRWGGSLENRMRFLVEVYQHIRSAVGPEFPVGVKLNSADFQKGGFSEEDSILVAKKLSEIGVDLIEVSGGNYEAPSMTGTRFKPSTVKREAYFLDYVTKLKKEISTPLLLTGGFRTPRFMEEILKSNALDMIGLARPLAIDPDFPNKILSGAPEPSLVHPIRSGFKSLDSLFAVEITWYTQQLHRIGQGKRPNPKANVLFSMAKTAADLGFSALSRTRA